ncbi:MAG: DUF1016 N-terminal domain-containing protein [Candidatus Omnitrophica bacterium]|nr:DUF1016 N-terminal domain-containing protein [Candidatus Omnitrophota bacterium]
MSENKLVAGSYKKLVTEIASLYQGARKALVEAYWRIGQRIVQVEQQGAVKAAYGVGLLQKLSEDLTRQLGSGFSERQLREMRRFYFEHRIRPPAAELSWTQHVELLKIEDVKQRKTLERKAILESLKRDEIRELVRHELVRAEVEENLKTVPEEKTPVELLTPPKDLTLHTYKKADIPSAKGACVLDCGFYVYREVTKAQYESASVMEKPSYAYEATVERVIDGDTLWAVIDVGFGTQVREKLRLRGIDCPELGTDEGEAAKRFVTKLLPAGGKILIVSSKTDKYTRYLADIFYKSKEGSQVYLNNEILSAGLAVNMGD